GARSADGRDQRRPAGLRTRLRAPDLQPGWAVDAVVLAGHGHHPVAGVLARPDSAADLRAPDRELLVAHGAVHAAGAGGGLSLLGADHADHALGHARGPA